MLEYRIIQSKANFCSEQALKLQNHISLHHLLKLIKYYFIRKSGSKITHKKNAHYTNIENES